MICTACGKTGKSLKLCTACKEVRYCDVTCQKKHRKKHRQECKQKASEMKSQEEAASGLKALSISVPPGLDDPNSDLWKSPPRPDCPICMLPLPLEASEIEYKVCCGNILCCGCVLKNAETIEENKVAHRVNVPLVDTCVFCREPAPSSKKHLVDMFKKRMELNDSEAFLNMAYRYSGGVDVPKDEQQEIECLLRAAELGNTGAYYWLAYHYKYGKVVEADDRKHKECLQLSAMGGDVLARHNLGVFEDEKGNGRLAILHWRLAAHAGLKESLDIIKKEYKQGHVSKDDFAETLRAYHAAQEEMKSEERNRYSSAREMVEGGGI